MPALARRYAPTNSSRVLKSRSCWRTTIPTSASADCLIRIFAGSFGQSPSRVYRILRLRFGEWLLQNTQDTVTSIALKCGYADASHFTRQFQCEFRATPTEVRNRKRAHAKKGAALPLNVSVEPTAAPFS